jgi:hypothetical protein
MTQNMCVVAPQDRSIPRVYVYDGYPGDANVNAQTLRVHARRYDLCPADIQDVYGHGDHHSAGASVRVLLNDGNDPHPVSRPFYQQLIQ